MAQEIECFRSPPPPVLMSKCPWERHWTPNCSRWSGQHAIYEDQKTLRSALDKRCKCAIYHTLIDYLSDKKGQCISVVRRQEHNLYLKDQRHRDRNKGQPLFNFNWDMCVCDGWSVWEHWQCVHMADGASCPSWQRIQCFEPECLSWSHQGFPRPSSSPTSQRDTHNTLI